MMKEVDRCIEVLELAKCSKNVALISSGDIYRYTVWRIMYEVIDEKDDVEIEVISGVYSNKRCSRNRWEHQLCTIM